MPSSHATRSLHTESSISWLNDYKNDLSTSKKAPRRLIRVNQTTLPVVNPKKRKGARRDSLRTTKHHYICCRRLQWVAPTHLRHNNNNNNKIRHSHGHRHKLKLHFKLHIVHNNLCSRIGTPV